MFRPMLLLVLFPFAAVAALSVPTELSAKTSGVVGLSLDVAPLLVQDTTRRPQEPPPQQRRGRRRPSFVGYMADGAIASQVRIFFDAASEIDVPDRAEFFYAKCGCYRDLLGDPAHDPDAPGPGPGIVAELGFQQLYLQAEYAPTERFSLFAVVPMRWVQPKAFVAGTGSFEDQSGLSDLRAGVKFGLVGSQDQRLTLQLQATAPTGAAEKGLGTDHWSVEPALLAYQRVSDRVTLEGQLGAVVPIDGSAGVPTSDPEGFAGTILFYGIGPALEAYSNETIMLAPVVELIGWRVLDGFQTAAGQDASAEDINILNLKLGARLFYGDRNGFYAGYGTALSDRFWYDHIFRVEYRYGF